MDTFSTRLKQARKIMSAHMKTAEGGQVREAETSRHVEEVLRLLCGYDPLTHLNRERRVSKGVSDAMDFVVILPPNVDAVRLIVEVKSISKGLSASMHHNQVRNYALTGNCEWTLLTDGKEWQLLHVDIAGNRELASVAEWDLFDDTPAELEKCFTLISLNSIKKERLAKEWKARKPLQPKILAKVLVSERVINAIRRTLKEQGFSTPEPFDLADALANDLLQAEHGLVAKKAFSPATKTPGQKAAETRRNNEGKQPSQTETT